MMEATRRVDVLRGVQTAIARVEPRVSGANLNLETSLVDDLGLDSLKFVDLTVALEDELGISEFPLQEWHDVEASRADPSRFTVASLVDVCRRCIEAQCEAGEGG